MIDEQIIRTKRRISFLQYMPKKPKRFGVKLWVLTKSLPDDRLHLQIYTGKTFEHGLTYHIVTDLTWLYENRNHMHILTILTIPSLMTGLIEKKVLLEPSELIKVYFLVSKQPNIKLRRNYFSEKIML